MKNIFRTNIKIKYRKKIVLQIHLNQFKLLLLSEIVFVKNNFLVVCQKNA